jgi:type I restriction enzyme S subunit
MNETLETMARAIFKDWFVDFGPTRAKMEGRIPYLAPEIWSLFPDQLDDEGKPKGWDFDRLGAFTQLQNGYAFKSSDWKTVGIPVVKIGSVKPSVVDLTQVSYVSKGLADERDAFRLKVGDALIGLTGYVGETGRIPPTSNLPLLNQRVARFSTEGKFSPFVYAAVRDPAFKVFAEGKSHGSAQANVSTKDILEYPMINPNHQIISIFDNLTHPFFDKSLSNSGEISLLSNIRDILLPKLMSGEIHLCDTCRNIDRILVEAN